MAQNFFEELHNKKQEILNIVSKAVEFHWIKEDDKNAILKKLDSDTLTIGVIGQMKCGKSTFLNSFVFEKDILPAATTPMTAALSVITYGEEKKIVAEFYNENEWQEQKMQASRSLSDVEGNTFEESKIKAAKDLIARATNLGDKLPSFLGRTQEDTLDNLIDYVGADGKYVSITKCVTVYYPKEYLKGVEIVDTPGFNDPIVSREERTKDFLKKADVVLMMLYAGRPFDATDRNILFQNVRQCGVGKVIIGINKYDIPYEKGETMSEIKDYVKDEIKKACRECEDNSLVEILKLVEPIPLSAEMALLSQLPMNEIVADESFDKSWNRCCKAFGIGSQPQFYEMSNMVELVSAIKNMVETEKGKILFAKPYNTILAAGNNKKEKIGKDLRECEMLLSDLGKPDYELEEKEADLDKAERRLTRKIESLREDIDSELNEVVRSGKNELEDLVDDSCRKMRGFIDAKGHFTSAETIYNQICQECTNLETRILKRAVETIHNNAKRKILNCISMWIDDVEDVLMRYFEDLDSKEFAKSLEKNIQIDIENTDLFSAGSYDNDEKPCFGDALFAFMNGATYGLLGNVTNMISHSDDKNNLNKLVTSISSNFNPTPYLENIHYRKDEIISKVKTAIIDELISKMREQLKEIRSKKSEKEKLLQETQVKIVKLKDNKRVIEEQLSNINLMNL